MNTEEAVILIQESINRINNANLLLAGGESIILGKVAMDLHKVIELLKGAEQ